MRISTSTLFNANVTQLNTLEASLLQTQQQISTGRRIVTPADDPNAAAQVLQVTQTQATNQQYIANIGTANDAVTLAEGTMQSVTTLLQNVQSTAVSAGNAALSNTDRQSLAGTLQSDLTQLIAYANTKDANGNYLFSGFMGNTQPFVQTQNGVQYNGDNGQRMIQVSANQQVAASDSGASIFMNIKNGSGTFVAGPASSGSSVITSPVAAITPYAFSGTNATLTVDGTTVTVNQDVTISGTGTGPGTLAAALQAGLTAAGLTTYSVSASAGGGLQITNSASATAPVVSIISDPSGNLVVGPGTPANSGSGIISAVSIVNPPPTAAQMGNSYQITFNVAGGVTTYSITGADATGSALPTVAQPSPPLSLPTAQPYTSGQSISLNGVQFSISGTPANGDTFTVTPSTHESVFTTISNLINTLNTGVNPNNPASQALLTASLNHAQDSLSNALSNVLTVESSQGARLNQLTAMTTNGNNLDVQYQQTIANLQDVDINKAISDLTQQKTILTAAQQSFVQIENLSMFNYLR